MPFSEERRRLDALNIYRTINNVKSADPTLDRGDVIHIRPVTTLGRHFQFRWRVGASWLFARSPPAPRSRLGSSEKFASRLFDASIVFRRHQLGRGLLGCRRGWFPKEKWKRYTASTVTKNRQ